MFKKPGQQPGHPNIVYPVAQHGHPGLLSPSTPEPSQRRPPHLSQIRPANIAARVPVKWAGRIRFPGGWPRRREEDACHGTYLKSGCNRHRGRADLGMFRRFVVEPGLMGLDWPGFRDPNAVQRRFDTDSYLGEDNGRLIVDVAPGTRPGNEPAGLVSYRKRYYGTQAFCWEIGIALLPGMARPRVSAGALRRCSAPTCSRTLPCSESRPGTHAENAEAAGAHWKRPGSPSKAPVVRAAEVPRGPVEGAGDELLLYSRGPLPRRPRRRPPGRLHGHAPPRASPATAPGKKITKCGWEY